MLRLAVFIALTLAGAATAQDRQPSHCIALVENTPGIEYIQLASVGAPLPEFTVRLHYLTHAMFLLETPGGLSAVTDYTGYIGTTELVPDVATMNQAHSSHWTSDPDPRIPNLLPGWKEDGSPADHYLDLDEMLVRSVSTDIRGGYYGDGRNGNSIFIFETAGLCIGHLGHLHHEPTPEQYAAIGRLDVVMAAVDGGLTMDLPTMIRTLQRFKSSVVIPMHWFGRPNLDRFLAGMSEDFAIEQQGASELEVSLRTLPERPTIIVLEPALLDDL